MNPVLISMLVEDGPALFVCVAGLVWAVVLVTTRL